MRRVPMPLYARLFFSVVALSLFWVLLNQYEQWRNPAGFDLGTQYMIEDYKQLSKQSFEAWQENPPE